MPDSTRYLALVSRQANSSAGRRGCSRIAASGVRRAVVVTSSASLVGLEGLTAVLVSRRSLRKRCSAADHASRNSAVRRPAADVARRRPRPRRRARRRDVGEIGFDAAKKLGQRLLVLLVEAPSAPAFRSCARDFSMARMVSRPASVRKICAWRASVSEALLSRKPCACSRLMVLVMVGGRTPSRAASWPGVWPSCGQAPA